jgi:two-component system, OmpR family, response regulator
MTRHHDHVERILVVEDEVRLARAVRRGLVDRGFDVVLAHDGHTGYRLARERAVDLIVLDLMLPGRSGMDVLRRLRSERIWTSVLVLTAKEGLSAETEALESGADDYLRKPFSYPVLVAHCRALLRRGTASEPVEIRVGDLVLDPRRRTTRRRDVPIHLTRREFALLEYLMRDAGHVHSREAILADVWGVDSRRDANVVEVYIGYLRRKVDQAFGTSTVRTVRGQGYMVDAAP